MGPRTVIPCLVALVKVTLTPSVHMMVEHPSTVGPPPLSPSLASSNAPMTLSSGSETVYTEVHVD